MRVVHICFVILLVFCRVDVNAYKHHDKTKAKHSATSKTMLDWEKDSSLIKIVTIDEMVDVIIAHAPILMKTFQLDPFRAPNQKQSTLALNLELKEPKVYNLTNIKRTQPVVVMNDPVNGKLHALVKLKFTNLRVDSLYDLYIKSVILRVGSKGRLIADLSGLDVDVKVTIDFKKVNATLDDLILSVGANKMKVTLSNSVEAGLATVAIRMVTPLLKNIIVIILEDPIKKQINKIISTIRNNILGSIDKYTNDS